MKTKEEIDEFILYNQDKSRINACTLGCGQVIKNQVIEYALHQCILDQCVNWKTKCRKCRAVLGPTGNILNGKDEIYKEWDTHDRKIKRINELSQPEIIIEFGKKDDK
jgi:hypothetical protein